MKAWQQNGKLDVGVFDLRVYQARPGVWKWVVVVEHGDAIILESSNPHCSDLAEAQRAGVAAFREFLEGTIDELREEGESKVPSVTVVGINKGTITHTNTF